MSLATATPVAAQGADIATVTTTIAAAASRGIIVPLHDMIGFRYIKIRSGTAGTPVNQTDARTLTLICVR